MDAQLLLKNNNISPYRYPPQKRKRNQRGKKRGNRFRENRRKHWFKEQARRANKITTIRNQDKPTQVFSDTFYNRVGLQTTKTFPQIFWCENPKERLTIQDRPTKEWREIVATTVSPTDSGKQATVRFKTIPEFETPVGASTSKKGNNSMMNPA